MRPTVAAAWRSSITGYEGEIPCLYWDTHNPPLPTTGIGNMIGSASGLSAFGLGLPWVHRASGRLSVPESEIAREAARLRALGIERKGGAAYLQHATLFLSDETLTWLLESKTAESWATMLGLFPDLEQWPADAQLAYLNMAWWMGPSFTATGNGGKGWPNLAASLRAQDWVAASKQCTTVETSQRNPDNVLRFQTAARVQFAGLDPGPLFNPAKGCADRPAYPAHPVAKGYAALIAFTASRVDKASPASVVPDVFYPQRALSILRFYAGPLDGLWGAQSRAAFDAWAKGSKVSGGATAGNLARLMVAAGLRMEVRP